MVQAVLAHRAETGEPATPTGANDQQVSGRRGVDEGSRCQVVDHATRHQLGLRGPESSLDVHVERYLGIARRVLRVERGLRVWMVLVEQPPRQHGRQAPATSGDLAGRPDQRLRRTFGSIDTNHDLSHDVIVQLTDPRRQSPRVLSVGTKDPSPGWGVPAAQ